MWHLDVCRSVRGWLAMCWCMCVCVFVTAYRANNDETMFFKWHGDVGNTNKMLISLSSNVVSYGKLCISRVYHMHTISHHHLAHISKHLKWRWRQRHGRMECLGAWDWVCFICIFLALNIDLFHSKRQRSWMEIFTRQRHTPNTRNPLTIIRKIKT